MKKVILVLVIALAVTMAVSAQNYVVQEVTNRVEREVSSGKWEPVKAGDTLRAETVIRTVIGASLTVKNGEQVLTVGALKNGKLSELVAGGSVIQIQGRVSETDTAMTSRGTGRVSTASARASDAAAGIDLEE